MKVVEVIKKFPQYEDIPYVRDFMCPNCARSGFTYLGAEMMKPRLIGWCETNIGYMGVFECPFCCQKFRFHCTIGTWTADIDEFDLYLYVYAEKCSNFDEIKNKL